MEHWGGGDPVLLRQEGTEVPLEGNIWSFRQDTRLPIHISRTLDSVWSNWTEAVLIMLRDGTQPRAEKPKPTAELRGKRVRGTAMANEQRSPQAQDNKDWSAHTAWDSRSPWLERPLTQKAFQRSYTQATLDKRNLKKPLLPQLTQLLVRTRSSNVQSGCQQLYDVAQNAATADA